jgi:hypothetical protein
MRKVEPLLPQSSGQSGAASFRVPATISFWLLCSIETPSARKQATVDAQSRAVEKFAISELPDARAAMSAARWDIDLSPGSCKRPLIRRAGVSFMMSIDVRSRTLQR